MSNEQFFLMMKALTRIIELLEKQQEPRAISVINQRGLPGDMFLSNTPNDKNPPLIDAIAKHMIDTDTP